MRKRRLPASAGNGFSLVEVALAIGLISFCLVSLVGLMSVGMTAVNEGREQAGAASAVEQIASAIRGAALTPSSDYRALGAFSSLSWTPGSGDSTFSLPLAIDGYPPTSDQDLKYGAANDGTYPPSSSALQKFDGERRFQARIVIQPPPADRMTPGKAFISVAWPGQAVWNAASGAWDKAQGSVSTWIYFLPAE